MRYIGMLNKNGEIVEEGFGQDNMDFTAIIGRPSKPGDRWVEGRGNDEDAAREAADHTFPEER